MKDSLTQPSATHALQPVKRVIEFLKSPFPYYFNDDKKNTLLCAGIGLFLLVFMYVFQPYHFTIFVISATTFAVLWFNIVLLPKIFPTTFEAAAWTVGKYMAFSLWQLLMDGFFICLGFEAIDLYPTLPFTTILGFMYYNVLIHAVIPIAISTLLFRNNVLKQNLEDAVKANRELEKIRMIKDDTQRTHANLLTINSDTRESLQLSLAQLLYIEASENYSTVFWKGDQGVESRMLRIHLKNLEGQLDNHFTIRCHRSYLVNINAIEHVTGNANGYKLGIKGTTTTVPVSRTKGKEVMDRIEQLRNVLELG